MADPTIPDVKYSTYVGNGTGTKTAWDFNFAGPAPGYLDKSHVKVFTTNTATGVTTVITGFTWTGTNTINVTPAVPLGSTITIWRDTPKNTPVVNYTEGSIINEVNLDLTANQSVFAAAETTDRIQLLYTIISSALAVALGIDSKATTALANSAVALATALGVDAKASTALDNSIVASGNATSALSVANAIANNASTALQSATSAVTTANAAASTANAIAATASNALNVANTAQSQVSAASSAAVAATSAANAATAAVAGKQNALGYTPVRQGGGYSQSNNVVYIGWSSDGHLRATVDNTDLGYIATSGINTNWSVGQSFQNGVVVNGNSTYNVRNGAGSFNLRNQNTGANHQIVVGDDALLYFLYNGSPLMSINPVNGVVWFNGGISVSDVTIR